MADGTPIENKIYSVLTADTDLIALLATDANGDKAIYLGDVSPTGVRYPAIAFRWVEFESREQLPVTEGMLQFFIEQSSSQTTPYETYRDISYRLLAIFNRNYTKSPAIVAQPLTEINEVSNEGLRVVKILKVNRSFEYKKEPDKFISLVEFMCQKSEDEDFSKDYGNGSWS